MMRTDPLSLPPTLFRPDRRRFAARAGATLIATPGLLQAGGSVAAAKDLGTLRDLADAGAALDAVGGGRPGAQPPVRPSLAWAPMLVHCAQSIEYSMSGFPEPKSALFQATAGHLAFRAFAWRGRMSHDLDTPIPGAPAIAAETDAVAAMRRLRTAIGAFRAWSGPLQPHFAYGSLERADYERAHAMHLAEHLAAFGRAG